MNDTSICKCKHVWSTFKVYKFYVRVWTSTKLCLIFPQFILFYVCALFFLVSFHSHEMWYVIRMCVEYRVRNAYTAPHSVRFNCVTKMKIYLRLIAKRCLIPAKHGNEKLVYCDDKMCHIQIWMRPISTASNIFSVLNAKSSQGTLHTHFVCENILWM